MKAVGTNGVGEPRYPVDQVPPGSICRFGIDDDSVVMVVANHPTFGYVGKPGGGMLKVPRQRIVMFGCMNTCFGDGPGDHWHGRLFHMDHELTATMTVLLTPGV